MLQREMRLMLSAANMRKEGLVEPSIPSRDRLLPLQFVQQLKFDGGLHSTNNLKIEGTIEQGTTNPDAHLKDMQNVAADYKAVLNRCCFKVPGQPVGNEYATKVRIA